MKRGILSLLLTSQLLLLSIGTAMAGETETEGDFDFGALAPAPSFEVAETSENVEGVTLYVQGYEWGPGVPMLIVELKDELDAVDGEGLLAATANMDRTVTGVCLSDEKGNPVDGPSRYVTIAMETSSESSGSPFSYDLSIFMNKWSESYPVLIQAADFQVNGDYIDSRICPDSEIFSDRGQHVGTYLNAFTGEEEEVTIRYAATEPEGLQGGEKNPLVIWLHGQGEGGTDPDIEIIGNEVCALARDEIQSYFTAGDQTGAYILACQCETYWMDEGDGTNGNGSGVSRYTEALMDTIKEFVSLHDDVDPNRIYLGGCSNGGYMTVNMLIHYPDYFAAAYPNCEAYAYWAFEKDEDGTYKRDENGYIRTDELWVTEEKIDAIKDIPIWFSCCINDPIVDPTLFVLPTYKALLEDGAENAYLSVFESALGTDSPGTEYMGHFVWIYTFNNQVTHVQDAAAIIASADDDMTCGVTASNDGGGSLTCGDFANLFEWMNAQSK